jgi:hypothetical protein
MAEDTYTPKNIFLTGGAGKLTRLNLESTGTENGTVRFTMTVCDSAHHCTS